MIRQARVRDLERLMVARHGVAVVPDYVRVQSCG